MFAQGVARTAAIVAASRAAGDCCGEGVLGSDVAAGAGVWDFAGRVLSGLVLTDRGLTGRGFADLRTRGLRALDRQACAARRGA
ncbi:MAG: hypothetical protein ACLPUT_02410 [Solirubrobacteraceae bacterium]